MGRYYNGDIEGKFWFGVQASDSADRFGRTGYTPNYIEYSFTEEDLSAVEEEIKNIEEKLGDKKQVLDDFFKSVMSYTDEMLEAIGITPIDLSEYADLILGKKIQQSLIENGQCDFQAEL
jgi:threonyl-tRNA synthetase